MGRGREGERMLPPPPPPPPPPLPLSPFPSLPTRSLQFPLPFPGEPAMQANTGPKPKPNPHKCLDDCCNSSDHCLPGLDNEKHQEGASKDSFQSTVDLVKFIRTEFGNHFTIALAGGRKSLGVIHQYLHV